MWNKLKFIHFYLMDLIVSKYTMIYLYLRDMITELNTVANHVSGEISIIKKNADTQMGDPSICQSSDVFFFLNFYHFITRLTQ